MTDPDPRVTAVAEALHRAPKQHHPTTLADLPHTCLLCGDLARRAVAALDAKQAETDKAIAARVSAVMDHHPTLTTGHDGTWMVFCSDCSTLDGDWVYPCREHTWQPMPPQVLRGEPDLERACRVAVALEQENAELRERALDLDQAASSLLFVAGHRLTCSLTSPQINRGPCTCGLDDAKQRLMDARRALHQEVDA